MPPIPLILFRRALLLRSVFRVARFLVGLAILLLFQWMGSWIVGAVRAPLPGSVLGMALLAGCIYIHILPLWLVRPAAEFLVRHLAVLYVPAGVALMLYAGLLQREWLPVTIAALVSLVAVLLAVGATVQRMERHA